jgi:EmrB/QacA subfamily drug resistance transporter
MTSTPDPRRWLILSVVLAAECMDLLDGTIVNVAAPTLHADLHASASALQWVVGGYALAIAVGLLSGARLGDLYGRRRLFLIGAAGFTLASAACGLAPSSSALIAFRLSQGAAGALMLPQGLGLLREVFPAEEMTKAFGVYGPVLGSAALLGPIVGGALIGLDPFGASWRAVFLVNVPLGIAAFAGAWRLLPAGSRRHASRLDLPGAAIATVSALLLVYPLTQGRELGWPPWTFVSIAASFAGFAGFAVHLRRGVAKGKDPLVLPSVFAQRGFAGGIGVLIPFFAGMVGSSFSLMLFLQLGHHFSALHAGLTMIPFSLGAAVTAPVAATKATQFGRSIVQVGAAVSLAGYALLLAAVSASPSLDTWDLAPALLVSGLGFGMVITPLFDTILAAVSDPEIGSASGALNALQQLAAAIGVAVLGTVFFSAASHGGFAAALRRTLWWELLFLAVMLGASTLLPRRAREPLDAFVEPHVGGSPVDEPQAGKPPARVTA